MRSRILLSTSLRSGRRAGGRGEEVSGSLLSGELDVERRRLTVERQIDLPESPHLPGRRSVRGVAFFAGGVAACTTSEVFLLDPELRGILRSGSDPRFGDLHSLAVRDGLLYVAATGADGVVGLDESLAPVFSWWAGDEPALDADLRDWQRERHRAAHDFRGDLNPGARFHLNHVFFDAETGDLLVNLPGVRDRGAVSRVWNVTRREPRFGGRPVPGDVPGGIHDGIIVGRWHYLCRTGSGDFLKLDKQTGELAGRVDCSVPLGATTGDPAAAAHGWLRGAAWLGDAGKELFLVGQSRLTLFLVDMESGTRAPVTLCGAAGDLDHPGLSIYAIQSAIQSVRA